MPHTRTAYHQTAITKALPHWSRQLPASHIAPLLKGLRKDYLDEQGRPYPWYANATAEQQAELIEAINKRDLSRKASAVALANLQGITTFCEPLLKAALNIQQPLTKAQYVFQPWNIPTPIPSIAEELLPGAGGQLPALMAQPAGPAQAHSLLAAALSNFTGLAEVGPLSYLRGSADSETALPGLTLHTFVSTCRTLDLGACYQQHLAEVFEGPNRAEVRQTITQANCDDLRVQAHVARLQGLLSEAGHAMLLELCAQAKSPRYAGRPATVRWLLLFDTPIHEVLLIGPQDDQQHSPCVLYIPGHPLTAVREWPSVKAVQDFLSRHLLQSDLRRLFISYAAYRQQPELTRSLESALFETLDDGRLKPRTQPSLRITAQNVGEKIWDRLYSDHLQRLKGNARAVAVATEDVDAAERLKRLEHWERVGMDVLNAAALVVPGLNTLMLAIGGAQVMGDIFHGIEAWEQGDHAHALAHVESLLLNALTVGALGGAAALVKASGFVDALELIDVNGVDKLWQPDLAGYAVEPAFALGRPNEQGLYRQGQDTLISMQGRHYKVFEDDHGRWRIRHPTDSDAYSPRLHHDGHGAWQQEHDVPLEWSDEQVLRRLGHLSEGLSDEELRQTAALAGISPQTLRRGHVHHRAAPASLIDALVRLRCDKDTDAIISAVREGKPLSAHLNYAAAELVNLAKWPSSLNVRVYDGPEPWGASQTYGSASQATGEPLQITRSQLENGELASTVTAQLDEQSLLDLLGDQVTADERPQALQGLLADHLQSKRDAIFNVLYAQHQAAPSIAASRIAQQFPRLPTRVLEEIVDHADANERLQLQTVGAKVPLRIAEEARRLRARVRLDQALMGLSRPALANADTQRLIAGLAKERPQLLNPSNAERFALLAADRALAGKLLGQQPIRPGFRSPLRLSDGRLGYPLSGRIAWPWRNNENSRLRNLYPSLNNAERTQLLSSLRAMPGTVGERITALEHEWRSLDEHLTTWVEALPAEHRESRQAFAAALRRAWRRETGDTLILAHMHLDALPAMPAQFAHISQIVMQGVGVEEVTAAFMHSFPNLRTFTFVHNPNLNAESLFSALAGATKLHELNLRNNALAQLPANALPTLAALPRLRRLNLRNNTLQLDATQLRALTLLELETLDLHGNALTLDAVSSAWFGDMVHLRQLDLSNNPLQIAPQMTYLARLQAVNLARTQLTHWPEGLTTLMSQHNFQLRQLDLSDNQIATLPTLDAILATPYARAIGPDHPDVRWFFNYNGLEPAAALRLREIGLGVFEHPPTVEVANEALDWRGRGTAQQQERWDSLFAEPQNTPLADILQRLTLSNEAQQDAQELGARVWRLLDRISTNTALRERIVELAREYPATCGDAGADAFSALELELRAYQLGKDRQTSGWDLYNFYRRLHRRELVNQVADVLSIRRQLRRNALLASTRPLPALAAQDAISDADLRESPVDDIEIRLALRQALRGSHALDYPEPSRGMLYRRTALLNDEITDNVEAQVRRLGNDQARQRDWIMVQPGWRLFLQRTEQAEFKAFDERWGNGLNYLYGLYDAESDGPLGKDVAKALENTLGSAPFDPQGNLLPRGTDAPPSDEAVTAYSAERQHAEGVMLKRLTEKQARDLGTD